MSYKIGVVLLAITGFATSIFVVEIAFAGQAEMVLPAQLGALLASVFAGVAAYRWLSRIEAETQQLWTESP